MSLFAHKKRHMEFKDEYISTVIGLVLLCTSELMPFMNIRANGILQLLFRSCAKLADKQPTDKMS